MPIVDPYDTEIVDPFDSPEYQQKKQKVQGMANVGSRLSRTLSNYPGSYAKLAKGAVKGAYEIGKQVITHPMDTLGNVMQAGVENTVFPILGYAQQRNPQGGLGEDFIPDYERVKNAISQGPYGSMENYANYMEKNPAQAQADIAIALSGGGKLLKSVGEASKIGALGKVGAGMQRAGGIVEPLTAPWNVSMTAMRSLPLSKWARKLYASSAKMSKTFDPADKQRVANALLDAEVRLKAKDFKKLHDSFFEMTDNVDELLNEYVSKGANKKHTVLDVLDGLDKFEERARLSGQIDVVRGIRKRFIRNLTDTVMVNGKPMKVLRELDATQINRMKRDLYRKLHSNYGQQLKPMRAEAEMLIANTAMKLIEHMVKDVIPNNKTAKAYKEMMDAIRNGVNRIEDRDLLGLGISAKTGVGKAFDFGKNSNLGGILGLALGVVDLPSVKSWIAIRMNKLKKQGVKIRPTATAIKLGLAKYSQFEPEEKRNPIYPEGWTIRK